MLSSNSHTENHLIIRARLIGKLEFLFLPTVSHFWEPDYIGENFNFNHIILGVFKSKWLAVEGLIGIRVTPTVAIEEVGSMSKSFVVIKLILILLNCMTKHNSQENPRTHIKPIQSYINFAWGFTNIGKVRPIEFLITSPHNSIRNPIEVLAGINSKYIFSFYLSSFSDGLSGLFVIFLGDNIQFFSCICKQFLFVFQLVCGSTKLIC